MNFSKRSNFEFLVGQNLTTQHDTPDIPNCSRSASPDTFYSRKVQIDVFYSSF